MDHKQGQDRDQLKMISLDQMVEGKSMVRIIDAFVDMLNLEQFGFSYYKLNKEGRPPFHPATLMKLYLIWVSKHFPFLSQVGKSMYK